MVENEKFPKSKTITRAIAASKAVASLFRHDDWPTEQFAETFIRNASKEMKNPLNLEDATLAGFMRIAHQRNLIDNSTDLKIPYWRTGGRYSKLDIFNGTIQFFDHHRGDLPETVLPPEKDVRQYMSSVMSSERKLLLTDQFERLLDITGNNIVGAANLGFITSRLLYRGVDTRAYPDISLTSQDLDQWCNNIAQFEVNKENDNTSSAPSDTYYFWTHFFAALVYKVLDTPVAEGMNKVFGRGSEIMVFVKRNIARSRQVPHTEATEMGRNIGLAFAHLSQLEF